MTRKDLFDIRWYYNTIEGTLKYSSNNIQSMYQLMYLAIDCMKEALTYNSKSRSVYQSVKPTIPEMDISHDKG